MMPRLITWALLGVATWALLVYAFIVAASGFGVEFGW